MAENKTNERHQAFKKELRAYHDSINRKNRYNLPKISGKLNVFENKKEKQDEQESTVEFDRTIPNTNFSVVKKGDLYAIADKDGNIFTDFKYKFIEGCLGEHDKIIRCITDDGEIEDFDVETERILECAGGISTTGFGGSSTAPNPQPYHEIEYSKVKKDMLLPYLCCYRIKDISKKRKKKSNNPHVA